MYHCRLLSPGCIGKLATGGGEGQKNRKGQLRIAKLVTGGGDGWEHTVRSFLSALSGCAIGKDFDRELGGTRFQAQGALGGGGANT